ncbi:MAG: glycosyltransferase family 4 protein, partial [Candidatus Nanohalobium sp.]
KTWTGKKSRINTLRPTRRSGRMKIVTVIPNLYAPGGAEKICEYLMSELSSRGHEVTILTTKDREDRGLERENFEVKHCIERPWLLSDAFYKVPNQIRKIDPDVVHAFHVYPTAIWLRSVTKTPTVCSAMGDDIQKNDEYDFGIRQSWIKDRMIKATINNMDIVTVLGDYMVEDAVDAGAKREKVISLKNAVDRPELSDEYLEEVREKYGIDPDKKNILYLGRFNEKKRVIDLLEAFRELGPEYRLDIVGKGNEEQKLRNYVEENEMDNVEFLGTIFGDEKFAVYELSDVFVLPSFLEGTPTVLVEAALSDTKIVASDIPGNKVVTDAYNKATTFPQGDIEQLRESIEQMAEKEFTETELEEGFKMTEMADDVEEIYEDLTNTD